MCHLPLCGGELSICTLVAGLAAESDGTVAAEGSVHQRTGAAVLTHVEGAQVKYGRIGVGTCVKNNLSP